MNDEGLAQAMKLQVAEQAMRLEIRTHPQSIYAGSLGADVERAIGLRFLVGRLGWVALRLLRGTPAGHFAEHETSPPCRGRY